MTGWYAEEKKLYGESTVMHGRKYPARHKNLIQEFTPMSYALRERVKELACLYGISQISERFKGRPGNIFPDIVALIPQAWQYPEAAIARIVVDGKAYETASFIPRNRFQRISADIRINRTKRGFVEVAYTAKKPKADDGPFLKEERNLIRTIARQLAVIIEREWADEEKEKLQKQLMHADKLATIGQLAAGIAHELNEPLSSVLGFAQLVKRRSALPAESSQDIDKIVAASLHAREIIKKLLLFGRQTPPKKDRLNINEVIIGALDLFEHRFSKDGIEPRLSLEDRLPLITADPGQMTQVFVNLIANAVQAMPKGGTLSALTKQTNGSVACTIEDTGIGMSLEVQNKIFTPFFTTKDINEGTGLGLPVVHGIITSHGGTIEVRSAPHRGACFTITLPMQPKEK
jgi:two-component system NtrC family sensor kinase